MIITPPSKHQNRNQLVLLSFRVQPLDWQSFTDIGEMTCSTTAWCRPVDTLWIRYLSVFSFSFVYFLIYSLTNSFLFFFYHFILLILCFFSTGDINHSKGSKQKKKKRNKEKKKKRRAKKKAQKKSETSKGKSQRFLILEKIIVMNE